MCLKVHAIRAAAWCLLLFIPHCSSVERTRVSSLTDLHSRLSFLVILAYLCSSPSGLCLPSPSAVSQALLAVAAVHVAVVVAACAAVRVAVRAVDLAAAVAADPAAAADNSRQHGYGGDVARRRILQSNGLRFAAGRDSRRQQQFGVSDRKRDALRVRVP